MNQLVSALGEAVRSTRKSKNLSQEALAEKIGVCKRTIIDIEKNTGNPKFEILCMLVRELDLPLYQVFYPEETEKNVEIKNMLLQEISLSSRKFVVLHYSALWGIVGGHCTLKAL